jgi:iron complex outermembrane receptor protein
MMLSPGEGVLPMPDMHPGRRPAAAGACFLSVLLLGAAALKAQTNQLLTWQQELTYLQNIPAADLGSQRDSLVQIRAGVQLWLKLHPHTAVRLPDAPPQPWTAEQMSSQVSLLRDVVAAMVNEDAGQPFELGMTTVSVTAEASPLSPVVDTFDRDQILNRQSVNVAMALDYLPGVAIDHISPGRNEAAIRIRGFSTKGQIPFYIDGIQVSMPYDGTLDFNRFLADDVAELQVSKGFSSPLLGPNGMGGSINLVTRQPEKKLTADVLMGTGSAGMLLSAVNLGSRWEKFYVQGAFGWLQSRFVPLSGNFPLNNFQPNYDYNNSDTRDASYSGRFGWTPRGQDQVVFSYINHKGQKGVPLYAGQNPAATFNPFSYRRWPYWNKTAYYLITNTGLGESSFVKFRAYYDQFDNELDFYDNATFSTMNKTTSNHSVYSDQSTGGSAELTTRVLSRNLLSGSFFFRDDNHRERLEYPARPPYPFLTPTVLNRAQTFSIGFQDVIALTSRLRATAGFSADYNKGLEIQKLNSSETGLIPVTCEADPDNTSFSGCTAHAWNYNPQGSISYGFSALDSVYFTIADRGRFPLLKESYSYRLGTGIPNPDLKPEHNTSINLGYAHAFPGKTVAQVEYFYDRLRHAIQSAYIEDPGTLCPGSTGAFAGYCSQNLNIAREDHQGFELSIRSSPVSRLILDADYSYLNRTMQYDFGGHIDVSQVLTTVQILPVYPRNKVILNATLLLPHEVLAIGNFRYEGGIILQDTTYPRTSPDCLPFATSYGTVDLGAVVPIRTGFTVQAGVKNLFNRNYYYTAGYPEIGRNWFLDLRYKY